LLLALVGCTNEVPTIAVQKRLGPVAFGLPRGPHATMFSIANVGREVVVSPGRLLVADLLGVPIVDGRVRVELGDVDPATLRGRRLELEAQQIDTDAAVPDQILQNLADSGRFVSLSEGWQVRLPTDDDGDAVLSIEEAELQAALLEELDARQVNLRLWALEPIPRELRTEPFRVPEAASIEIGYGLVPSPAPGLVSDVSATLECASGATQTVLDERLTLEDAGWHQHRTPLPAGDGCQLILRQPGTATAKGIVVWTVPLLFAPEKASPPSVILISLDTLRADRLSGYGYPRETTPAIDANLIDRGVTFTNTNTTFGSTDVAHLSLLTGLSPNAQPILGRLPPDTAVETLGERLQDEGYLTAAFTEDGLVAGPFGFWFGFDSYTEFPVVSARRGLDVFEQARLFLRRHQNDRFFLLVHTYRVHDPFEAGPASQDLFRTDPYWAEGRLDPRIPPKARADWDEYDRGLVEADRYMAALLAESRRLAIDDRAIVVLVSDHGEAFGEHGVRGHSLTPYQEEFRIPLVFRGPGIPAGVRVDQTTGIVDVGATILDLVGASQTRLGEGRSLRPAFSGSRLDERPYFFRWTGRNANGVRLGRYKSIVRGERCMRFDLAKDPGERVPSPIPCDGEGEIAALRDHIAATQHDASAKAAKPEPATISPRVERSLKALGYLD